MREVFDEILTIDWSQVQLKRAASGVVALVVAGAFIGAAGDEVTAVVLAILFTTAAGSDGAMGVRLRGMARFTVYGAILGALAFWSAESAVAVALVLGVATYAGTLAAAAGPEAAQAGLYLTLWALFALVLGSADTEPLAIAGAFVVGGAIAIGVTALRLRVVGEDQPRSGDVESLDAVEGERLTRTQQLGAAMRSPIGLFAAMRAGAVLIAVLVGFTLFDSYPLWVAITVIVVVKPSAHQSASLAIQRTLGTAIGVLGAVGISQIFPTGDVAIVVAFIAAAFLMVAFNNANYTLFATFLSAVIVLAQRLIQGDAFEAGWERLLATAAGGVIALVVATLARLAARQVDPALGSDPSPPS